MNSIDLKSARRSALRLVRWQIMAAVVIAVVFMLWRDPNAAISALVGGGIGVAAGLAMVAIMFRETPGADPRRIVRNAYKGEAAKLGTTVLLFIVALKFLAVQPLPLFIAYIATLVVHWIALVRIR